MKCENCNERLTKKSLVGDVSVCSKECLAAILNRTQLIANTEYKLNYNYRSLLEQRFADFLGQYSIPFVYEPIKLLLHKYRHFYIPDFYIPLFGFIEIKGIMDTYSKNKIIEARKKIDITVFTQKQLQALGVYYGSK